MSEEEFCMGYFEVYKNGKLIDRGPNKVTNLGRKWILDRWRGRSNVLAWESGTAVAFLAVGEGSGITNIEMSGLINEVGLGSDSRAPFFSVVRDYPLGSELVGSASYGGSGGVGNLWEVGKFVTGYDDADSLHTATATKDTGILFGRRTFDSQVLIESGTSIEFRYVYSVWDS